MVSFAATGGSVGAHVDQYDVFLLQAHGHRRWQIDASPNPPLGFRDDVELKLLRDKELTASQLHVAKNQLMGQLAMSEESNSGLMQLLGKSTLDLGRVEPLSEIFGRIERVTAGELREMANDVLSEDNLSILQYVPEK